MVQKVKKTIEHAYEKNTRWQSRKHTKKTNRKRLRIIKRVASKIEVADWELKVVIQYVCMTYTLPNKIVHYSPSPAHSYRRVKSYHNTTAVATKVYIG